HKDQPLERPENLHRSMQYSKHRFSRMTAAEILTYSAVIYGTAGLKNMSGMLPKRQALNLVISNVPGQREPLYWNGAKLDALSPASI
ncbi:WS/DGAT domain-containing protein, partial [Acinetobacter baumannii]|uniref:WS/DGAT domain-containing protein n=1 Tax=Acinetobacter baumannii TaxID=470 RepID=UPI000AD81235